MGKQAITFVKAQTLAMHYIKCCELVALFTILAHRLGNLFTTYSGMVRSLKMHKTMINTKH